MAAFGRASYMILQWLNLSRQGKKPNNLQE